MISRILLNLMMLQSILTKITVEDIKRVGVTSIGKNQDVIINPEGPLNLLRGYIGQRSGHMNNKRFYSSEIETNYSLRENGLSITKQQNYDFTRTPANDRVYKDIATQAPNGKYLSAYHEQLIKMFPSEKGDLSIEGARSNTLTNFLRTKHVKKDAKYILAALLLLSEGVDIKIAVDHEEGMKCLIIKRKASKDNNFVSILMHAAGIDAATNEHSYIIYQSEVAEIIDFYRQCRASPLLKKGGVFAMPTTKKEFESGKFLNNARFLIQAYIYEFIDTVEDYTSFVNAVHELLSDQMTEKSNLNDNTRVFNELFIEKSAQSKSIKYTTPFDDLVNAAYKDANFPFYSATQLPAYIRVPQCKLDKTDFVKEKAIYYNSRVETALLGLFCCLAYNPRTKSYQTSHMGKGISKELKEFFEMYPKPTESIGFEMHKEWSKVVACLKNDKINYKQERNELCSGVANIFLAIAEITGQKKDTKELVQHIESACRLGRLNFDDDSEVGIYDAMESIIMSLSQNKDIELDCSMLKPGKSSNGKADLFGKIKIVYTFDKKRNGVALNVESNDASLALLSFPRASSKCIEEMYKKIGNIYNGMDSYTGYIATNYSVMEIDNLRMNRETRLDGYSKNIIALLNNESKDVSKVFLLGKPIDIEYKYLFVIKFMLYSLQKDFPATHPFTRISANMLGSVPLDDNHTMRNMTYLFPFHPRWQVYYPNLGYKPSQHLPREKHGRVNLFYNYRRILVSESVDIAVKCIETYLTMGGKYCTDMFYTLSNAIICRMFLNHVVEEGKIPILSKLHTIIERYKTPKDAEYVNDIYMTLFVYACCDHSKKQELIKLTYSLINFDDLRNPKVFNPVIDLDLIAKVLLVVKTEKDLLHLKSGIESKQNYDTMLEYLSCSKSK
ncbi:hypothetical protein NERG_00795 [Nematocida ausubeli]|uniref:Uncharacterized protein n=1 Tax=Nematocida ausubeli (strain ATCC PRA-371 / ERTm2) TaxID=1913371 RepID=H8ZB46_NEMA1|nr:hypothetical protein NERG_00795 [Nematocida ausubeli]